MRKTLLKLFVKDYKDTSNEKVRAGYGKLSGLVGIVSNFILAVAKMITGFLSGSISIMADGVNNLSDGLSSVITLIGFKISTQPADREHPFGHYRIEYVTGLVVSFIILLVGLFLIKSSIEKIINPAKLDVSVITIIILGASILVKIWQGLFYRKNGKEINSGALITLSKDSFNDVISSLAILISSVVILIYPGVNLDGYMGLIVSVIIIISGIKQIKDSSSPLIGEAPSREYFEKLNEEITSYPKVLGVHDIVIHKYGETKTFMTAHIEVDINDTLSETHQLADKIEQDFLDKHQINLVIHIDPIDLNDEETLKLKDELCKILEKIDPILNFHDFRVVKHKMDITMYFDLVIPHKFKIKNSDLEEVIKREIKLYNDKMNIQMVIDEDYYINYE